MQIDVCMDRRKAGNVIGQAKENAKMASNIRIAVDETARGLTIRWLETGLERHVWVDQSTFEQFLASGETIYLDTPAIATDRHAVV